MAFDNDFTAVVGATYTAAQYNTYTRDNFTAIWVYTTAGDIAYASAADALSRLGIGNPYDVMRVNSAGNAPSWGGYIAGMAYLGSNQSINNVSTTPAGVNVEFASAPISNLVTWSAGSPTRLTIGVTGFYIFGYVLSIDGGSGYRQANILKNGTDVYLETRYPTAAGETTNITGADVTLLTAGDYLVLNITHNESSAINVRLAELYAVRVGG